MHTVIVTNKQPKMTTNICLANRIRQDYVVQLMFSDKNCT